MKVIGRVALVLVAGGALAACGTAQAETPAATTSVPAPSPTTSDDAWRADASLDTLANEDVRVWWYGLSQNGRDDVCTAWWIPPLGSTSVDRNSLMKRLRWEIKVDPRVTNAYTGVSLTTSAIIHQLSPDGCPMPKHPLSETRATAAPLTPIVTHAPPTEPGKPAFKPEAG